MYNVREPRYLVELKNNMLEEFEELNEQEGWTKLDLLQSCIELTFDYFKEDRFKLYKDLSFDEIMCLCDMVVNCILDMPID